VYPPHPLASSTTPHHPTSLSLQDGETSIYVAAKYGNTDAVKELVAAGCDINRATKVKQMTRLALALACLCFRTWVA
jgi:ankyrin repeat protein